MTTAIMHNSYDENDRMPFGAVPCCQHVRLRIKIATNIQVSAVLISLHIEGLGDNQYELTCIDEEDNLSIYEINIKAPDKATLMWYYFIIKELQQTYYYGKHSSGRTGVGEIYSHIPPTYQITVFEPVAKSPNWYKDAIIYQIFVDRFYNGNEDKTIDNPKKESLIHAHWDNTPYYIRDCDSNRVVRWDIFGGNLLGVIKKLAYLRELGVSIIYLNPIFEAPSNHKYDTGDYHKVDSSFGTNELFKELCIKANSLGIEIILDGVFSHTGSDSIYFNKEGNYPSVGAYQSKDSPYYSWYRFREYPDDYECWWGVDVMPNVNELDPSYQEFIITGNNSVLNTWMNLGAKGWRLDVADELPDEFIKRFWKTMKNIDSDSVLIGEVWEDASNKISYGQRREYLLGSELDSVMNYPFRDAVINFLQHRITAKDVYYSIMGIYENYPKEYFYSAMNLLGTHDSTRLLTALNETFKKVKLAILWQMTFPGVPSIYYGDEAGITGGKDPQNRKTYPWGNENKSLINWYKKLTALRNEYDVLKTGSFAPFYMQETVFGYQRQIANNKDEFNSCKCNNFALVILNASETEEKLITLNINNIIKDGSLVDALDDYREVIVKDGICNIQLKPLEGKVLLLDRWGRSGATERKSGVLLHPSSLPSNYGIGDFGTNAFCFIDFLSKSKQKLWQILPLNPVGYGESPYQCLSVYAGNPLLIDIDNLRELGLLTDADLYEVNNVELTNDSIDFELVKKVKYEILKKAFTNFQSQTFPVLAEEFEQFKQEHSKWLADYALFSALKQHFNNQSWVNWDAAIAARNEKSVSYYSELLSEQIQQEEFLQYLFFKQWHTLKDYANSKGVKIIGDMPIYVAHDSCEVWLNQDLFKLDNEGNVTQKAGVPPDYFSETGQLWGNPIYNWDIMKQDDYSWWVTRIRHMLAMVDYIRIDHFRAFADYWVVPAAEDVAVNGEWKDGPGLDFFNSIQKQIGNAPFIAEDLGELSERAKVLKKETGFPGMLVMQFEIDANLATNFQIPLYMKNTVVYTGTHDNDTLLGWYKCNADTPIEDNEQWSDYICWSFIEQVYKSDADIALVPMQDLLCLGANARMNTPGTVDNNWKWRMTVEQLEDIDYKKLKELTKIYYRGE
ncbi:4-alpha-glucanotransferase [Desulfuribacillus alkaliarsenatis]|uniref:4-alpha-glucanotransferase n=1 Tax=Desulfuribacillus alkaliarsenatis TaxID=766136 RepID=A0A1E5G0D3_9FIRM|nr:4-alpha-glucanotransferase [Desulfuribacillus alkaliarsenatis]OEF96291.1 4-alpha-glucanotransferase [Desulfuribacillus alkaliarsenatis]